MVHTDWPIGDETQRLPTDQAGSVAFTGLRRVGGWVGARVATLGKLFSLPFQDSAEEHEQNAFSLVLTVEEEEDGSKNSHDVGPLVLASLISNTSASSSTGQQQLERAKVSQVLLRGESELLTTGHRYWGGHRRAGGCTEGEIESKLLPLMPLYRGLDPSAL